MTEESMFAQYKNRKISATTYLNYVAQKNGYSNYMDYQTNRVKNKGYSSLSEYTKFNCYKRGEYVPMNRNKECSLFLGVYIAEDILSKVFNSIKKMPSNNQGYDFICNKGYKIDVKCACLQKTRNVWKFQIRQNKIADYFLLLAFDNREDLNPMHVWMMKSTSIIQNQMGSCMLNNKRWINILNTTKSLESFSKFECKDKMDNIIEHCNYLKSGATNG